MIRGVGFGPPEAAVALVIRRTEYPQLPQGWGMMFHVEHWLSGAGLVIGGWLMFHVEHCHWSQPFGAGHAEQAKVDVGPAVWTAGWWFADNN